MATSGSIDSGGYGGRHLQFSWNTSNINIENNIRTISYSITAVGGSSSWYYHHNNEVWISGTNVYSGPSSEQVWNNTVLKSGTFDINQNETLTLTVEMSGGIYTYADNISTTESWSLDEIPRYLNSINLYDNGSTLNSISARWTCDPARDWTQYSINGGEWTNAGDSVASDNKSGSFTISGLTPGTTYSLKIRLRRQDSQLWSESGTINISTINKAIISSPSDNFSVNNDSSLTVTCSNQSGNDIAYFIDCPSGTRRLTTAKTKNTSYTWSSSDILSMLQYFSGNSSSIKIGVITYGDTEYYSEKVGTLNVVNSNPIFNDFTYEDINSTTLALTGNNQIIIRGYSNTKATISVQNKAQAQNYAQMVSYQLIQGTKISTIENYSETQPVELTAFGVDNNIMFVSAVDSRGNSTVVQKTLEGNYYKDYSELVILNLSAERDNNGVSPYVTLSFNGTFWNNNFGDVDNDIVSAVYQYKETNSSTWSQEIALTVAKSGSTFSGSESIIGDLGADGFDVGKSFDIRIKVKDKLSEKYLETTIGYGEPAIAIYKGNVAIGQKYDTALGGRFQINGTGYINGLNLRPEIITGYIDRKSFTISSNWSEINLAPFDSYVSNTNKIILVNNGLKINSNVTKLLISAHCEGIEQSAIPGDKVLHIKRNGSTNLVNSYASQYGGWFPLDIPSFLVTCEQGDIISLFLGSGGIGTGELLGEHLTIQIIE